MGEQVRESSTGEEDFVQLFPAGSLQHRASQESHHILPKGLIGSRGKASSTSRISS